VLSQICVFFKYFVLVFGLPSYSLDVLFHRAEVLILMKSNLSIIYFIGRDFGVEETVLRER
ncbi:hypothetical protein MK528_11475, partial [Streptococcus gordonii]|nr:hypothetical protein [Streptococcus gordonii]